MKQSRPYALNKILILTSEEQKQDLLDELVARQLVVEDAIESGLTRN